MPNYYETLNISPISNPPDIESAIDRLYNETRRKVNNFDPVVAANANQMLIQIEQMRATLLDPAQRQAYDNALGFGQAAGALLDPEAPPVQQTAPAAGPVLGMPSMGMPGIPAQMPLRPIQSGPLPTTPPVSAPKTTWTCPTCHRENPPKTPFCRECGAAVGLTCPKCNTLYEAATTQFCPSCGGHLATEAQRKKLQDRLLLAERQLAENQSASPRREGDLSGFRIAILRALAWAAVILGMRLLNISPPDLFSLSRLIENNKLPGMADSSTIFLLMKMTTLLAGLGVLTIVLAIVFRARWTAAWGALFGGVLLVGESLMNHVLNETDISNIDGQAVLLFLGLTLLVNLVYAAQPRKFIKAYEGQAAWFKPVTVVSHLCGWAFFFIAVANFFDIMIKAVGSEVTRGVDLSSLFSLAILSYSFVNWLLVAILIGLSLFGVGMIGKITGQVRQALHNQAQRTMELTNEIESLKQDISHLAR